MAMLSTYLENALLNATLRNTAYTSPATVYLALYTSNPTAADTGTEVTGGSYARQSIAFSAPSGGTTSNSATINFTAMPACTVTHMGIRDAAAAGNLLYFGPLSASKVVNSGDTFTLNSTDLALALT